MVTYFITPMVSRIEGNQSIVRRIWSFEVVNSYERSQITNTSCCNREIRRRIELSRSAVVNLIKIHKADRKKMNAFEVIQKTTTYLLDKKVHLCINLGANENFSKIERDRILTNAQIIDKKGKAKSLEVNHRNDWLTKKN